MLAAVCSLCAGCALKDERSQPLAQPSSLAEQPEASGELSASELEDSPKILTLTVPEGYTLPRIAMRLEEMGVCTVAQFIDATQQGDFSAYPLFAQQSPNENRCFRMEGYLFPDTYEFYADDPPDAIIRKMLGHMEQKIEEDLRRQIAESGYTADEILTMASIIEKEAFGHEQMPLISSVLHNRLNAGMQLQCDVTIAYVEGAIKPFIEGDLNRYNEHYNTYKCAALPAGPICNPGIVAILAALAPAQSDYFFFVTDAAQNYYYAATWDEHLANITQAEEEETAP